VVISNVPKLAAAMVIVLASTILVALGSIQETTFVALVGPIAGYLVGNGIAARSGTAASPIIGPREDTPG
jgi:proteasome assembly chaperone (PAC2) family protein